MTITKQNDFMKLQSGAGFGMCYESKRSRVINSEKHPILCHTNCKKADSFFLILSLFKDTTSGLFVYPSSV